MFTGYRSRKSKSSECSTLPGLVDQLVAQRVRQPANRPDQSVEFQGRAGVAL